MMFSGITCGGVEQAGLKLKCTIMAITTPTLTRIPVTPAGATPAVAAVATNL